MLHFSCDLCGRPLNDERFIVKLEVYPAFDPEELDPADLDVDHLQEIAEMLQETDDAGKLDLEECGTRKFRYDLCRNCHGKYVRDPLGRDALRRLNFSEN